MGQGHVMREAQVHAAPFPCNGGLGADSIFAAPLLQAVPKSRMTSFTAGLGVPPGPATGTQPGGGCAAPSGDAAFLKQAQEAESAATNEKLVEDIRDAQELQRSGEGRSSKLNSAQPDIDSPGGGNLRNPAYEHSLAGNVKNRKSNLNAIFDVERGIKDELAARLAMIALQGGAADRVRVEMVGSEMESPWTGFPDNFQAKHLASGLLEIPAPKHVAGAGHVLDTVVGQHSRLRPSSFVKAHSSEVTNIAALHSKAKEIPKVIKQDEAAHKAEEEGAGLRKTIPHIEDVDFHSKQAELDMLAANKNFVKQQAGQISADEAYQSKLEALKNMRCANSQSGEGLQRPEMLSAEQAYYKDARETPNKAKWGETERPPKGRGPEIGFGIETPLPFHGLTNTGEVQPSEITIAKFPGYAAEALPDQQSAMAGVDEGGDPFTGGAPTIGPGAEMSMPAVALHTAVLAPRWPRTTSVAQSRGTGRCDLHERRRGRTGSFL